MCVYERERERDRGRGREGERERELQGVNEALGAVVKRGAGVNADHLLEFYRNLCAFEQDVLKVSYRCLL